MRVGWISPDELDRWNWQQQADAQEEKQKQKKAPPHKEPPAFRCQFCQLSVRVAARLVCQATGRTVSPDAYPGVCAYSPHEVPTDA